MSRETKRLKVLVSRIDHWEDNPEPQDTLEQLQALRDAEELLLDIKQCLESVLETLDA